MVSVCMATKNGAPFLREQIDSILTQLNSGDELIISDDCSTDRTVDIVSTFQDGRITLVQNEKQVGTTANFERALRMSKGDFILLADQDDVWLPGKINTALMQLEEFDLVVSDCFLADEELMITTESLFLSQGSGRGFLKNLIKNSYTGCCMAFRREVLRIALPFPPDIDAHDHWIGMVAELHFKVAFMSERLLIHRRHRANASTTGSASRRPLSERVSGRYQLLRHLINRRIYAK